MDVAPWCYKWNSKVDKPLDGCVGSLGSHRSDAFPVSHGSHDMSPLGILGLEHLTVLSAHPSTGP